MTTKQGGADASDAPSRTDLYSRITGKMIADLEQGVRPYDTRFIFTAANHAQRANDYLQAL